MAARKIIAIDSETDPFLFGRVPQPFIWGSYDGTEFRTFATFTELIECYRKQHVYLFAHNFGKFDFHMGVLEHITETRAQIIGSRIVEIRIDRAILRDSFSLIPEPLEAYRKTKIEYWKLERAERAKHMREIIDYLRDDCVYLRDLIVGFYAACNAVGDGNTYRSTIASNALQVARRMGLDCGRTNHHFDDTFRPFYFGGRTECFAPGRHSNVHVFDILSAYPFAMTHSMPTGSERMVHSDDMRIPEGDRYTCFYDLTCRSNGAFPFVRDHELRFDDILGRFCVTGWEYMAAKRHGLLKDYRINRVYQFMRHINYEPYVAHWFEQKQAAQERGDILQRLVAKRLLTTLYGKLAQNPVHYFDYKICAGGTPVDYHNGWRLEREFSNKELHKRATLWRYQQKDPDDWQRFPIHYNVATAASITGFTRAMILDAIATIGRENVLYCDTDSLFCRAESPVYKLRQDGKVGSWDWEGIADPCGLAGKKLYALRYINGPKTGKEKIACKGAKLTFEQLLRICDGEIIEWRNQAPTFSLGQAPRFVVRNIRATAQAGTH